MEAMKIEEKIILNNPEYLRQRNYWRSTLLTEGLQKTELNFSVCNDIPEKDKNEVRLFKFPDTSSEKLLKISKNSDLSLYIILLTIFKIVIHRYIRKEEIIVESPTNKHMISDLTLNNYVMIKSYMDDQLTFKELLLNVRKSVLEAYQNQDYPIANIFDRDGKDLDEQENHLTEILLALNSIHANEYLNHIKNKLILEFDVENTVINFRVHYNTKKFNSFLVNCLIENYLAHADYFLNNLNEKISSAIKLPESETHILLNEFNSTFFDYPKTENIHNLIKEQVVKTPDLLAIKHNDEQFTYRELDMQADILAKFLIEKGIETNDIVGIMLERSIDMIVGLLGILKAGGAYLPIDKNFPENRIQYMLKDCNVKIVICSNEDKGKVTFQGITLAIEESLIRKSSEIRYELNKASEFAYVIYTSGSTGNPKGVLIKHSSIINTLLWRRNYYKFNSRDTILQIPPYIFDSSVEDIFTALISGSKLVIIDEDKKLDIFNVSREIERNSISHFLITPSLYTTYLNEIPESIKNLRIVTVAGEKCTIELVKTHFTLNENIRLINEYGPTECSVCSTVHEFRNTDMEVVIGKPISNVKAYICDKDLNLQPIGAYGELCISGDGLSDGYIGLEELTKEKFVINKYNESEIIYRTGDIARFLPDGNIQFSGRMDDQVKIRGYRVETGEIESRIKELDYINDAIVIGIDALLPETFLCAYVVSTVDINKAEIQDYLFTVLPDYMIPAHFIQIDELPLTVNGKLDRKSLPLPDLLNAERYCPPRNQAEKTLVAIWAEILGFEENAIGIDDKFFELGGQSLKALSLSSKIHKAFDVKISLLEIFENSTIRELSSLISQYTDKSDFSENKELEKITI